MRDVILELEQIEKRFDRVDALRGISLTVARGEFITLLGPSGCGKTTTLRILSGLEQPDAGRVLLEGKDVTLLEPNKRDVNTVFQNYALFPHMTVADNVGYSLKLRKQSKAAIRTQVAEVLELVQLAGYEARMPSELSGGQRQRVAIARSVVSKPAILLLDEPLGALDLQLRRQMQTELKRLQKQLGITFVYITHDQEEALNISDRIAVMRDGRIEQIDTPAGVYDRPATSFVARFVGEANVLSGIVRAVEADRVRIEHASGTVFADRRGAQIEPGRAVSLAVRGELIDIEPADGDTADVGLHGTVAEKSFAGGMLRLLVALADGTDMVVRRHGINSHLETGDRVRLNWAPEQAVPVDLDDRPSEEGGAHHA